MTGLKLLILSDSHRVVEPMIRAVRHVRPDHLIHLGDLVTDADALAAQFPQLPLISVSGNCDFLDRSQETRIVELGGVRLLLTHGHRHGVKQDLLRLSLAAREAQAQAALFGHTHRAMAEQRDGLWLINPGSCGPTLRPTCAVIEIDRQGFRCEIEMIHEWSEEHDFSR